MHGLGQGILRFDWGDDIRRFGFHVGKRLPEPLGQRRRRTEFHLECHSAAASLSYDIHFRPSRV